MEKEVKRAALYTCCTAQAQQVLLLQWTGNAPNSNLNRHHNLNLKLVKINSRKFQN